MSGRLLSPLNASARSSERSRGNRRVATPSVVRGELSAKPETHSLFSALSAAVGGSILMGLVNSSIGGTVLAVLLIGVGALLSSVVAWGRIAEIRAFLLTFGVCLLVGACLQLYSEAQFQLPMSTLDAWTFYHACNSGFESESLDSLEGTINAPLAVILWQTWYALAGSMGLGNNPFMGIELNACFVGLSAALTVKCGREIYGSDSRRLNGVATLCAFCGMFWLFGALFLRDCFSLFFSTLILWSLVRWLCVRLSATQICVLSSVLLFSTSCLILLRRESVYTTLPLILMAAYVKFVVNAKHLYFRLLLATVVGLVALGGLLKSGRLETVWGDLSDRRDSYGELGSANATSDSLGMRFVVSQPLPVRVAVGSMMLILHPLPLWAEFSDHMAEYHILKSYQALFMLWLFPWTVAGAIIAFRSRSGPLKPGPIYLSLYSAVTLCAIAMTSMESRHYGQFLAAPLLLAVSDAGTTPDSRQIIKSLKRWWWLGVAVIYAAWTFLKLR